MQCCALSERRLLELKVVAHNSSKVASTFTTSAPCNFVLVAVCASKSFLLSDTHTASCDTYLLIHFDCLQAAYDQLHAQVPCSDRADHVMLCPGAGLAGRLLQRGHCSKGSLRPVSFGSLSYPLSWSTCTAAYGASLIYSYAALCTSVPYVTPILIM